jgi:hypothetical protein
MYHESRETYLGQNLKTASRLQPRLAEHMETVPGPQIPVIFNLFPHQLKLYFIIVTSCIFPNIEPL